MRKASTLFVTGAAAALLPFAVAIAQTPPDTTTPPEQSQGGGATFESLDKDGDGRISKAEAESHAGVKAQFSTYDQNGDGFIERAEVNRTNNPQPEPSSP